MSNNAIVCIGAWNPGSQKPKYWWGQALHYLQHGRVLAQTERRQAEFLLLGAEQGGTKNCAKLAVAASR